MEAFTDEQTDAYLDRIATRRPAAPTADALDDLHFAHVRHVPFENLSIHLGEPVDLACDALFDKIVTRRRGGFCYELNGAFASLLTSLGYQVDLLAASVYGADADRSFLFAHMALRVNGDRLVDVGFGRHSAHSLRLDNDTDQADPFGTFRVTNDGPTHDVIRDGNPEYRLEPTARRLVDFAPACWWQQTAPSSHFRAGLVCSLQTATGGQVTLSGTTLTETEHGERTQRELGDDEALRAYRDRFGITLPHLPTRVDS